MLRITTKMPSTSPILTFFFALTLSVLGRSAITPLAYQGNESPQATHRKKSGCESGVVASSLLLAFPNSEPDVRVQAETVCPLGAELKFRLSSGNVLYSYSNGDHFLYMFPGGLYSHLLLSLWEGGSHIGIRIFTVRGHSITKVFDKQIKAPPEFITASSDEVILVLSRPKPEDSETEITVSEIYMWDGAEFKLARTVPMKERFSAIAALMSTQ